MKIFELFSSDKAVPFKWQNAGEARAELPDGRYLDVYFRSSSSTEWNKHPYSVEFSVNDEYEITGGGDTNTIFATVIEVIKDFVKKSRWLVALYFTAEERSRARMYDTLAKRVSKQLGWHVVPYDDMVQDPKYQTPLSSGDFLFAIEPGSAPEHRQAAQQPQHGEFMPIYYVHAAENDQLPAIKIKAKNASKAEEWVYRNVPEYKNEHPMSIMGYKKPPQGKKVIDMGTATEKPKPPEREPTELEKRLRDKIGA